MTTPPRRVARRGTDHGRITAAVAAPHIVAVERASFTTATRLLPVDLRSMSWTTAGYRSVDPSPGSRPGRGWCGRLNANPDPTAVHRYAAANGRGTPTVPNLASGGSRKRWPMVQAVAGLLQQRPETTSTARATPPGPS